MEHLVKVIIPIYKAELKWWEQASLENTIKVLDGHPLVLLKPTDLDLSKFIRQYPQLEVMDVTTEWLGTQNGIAGYNKMMMSKEFYDMFSDTRYILICHLDAWILRDDLLYWCQQDYDLVAAPWPMRPRYTHFPIKQLLWLRKRLLAPDKNIRSDMFGRIGNGGLCLRKVSAFSTACRKYADEIAYYLSRRGEALYNEDLFWALVPQDFNYPTVETALQFAFDLKPRLCYQLNHQELPMGCHGFQHRRRVEFWKQFLPIPL
ncbi:MAG: hypothetical protein IJ494_06525 [Bacteroides sp.]|nr:hypothetical protein [Bacteroides sp.]